VKEMTTLFWDGSVLSAQKLIPGIERGGATDAMEVGRCDVAGLEDEEDTSHGIGCYGAEKPQAASGGK
jgi:hypothetical protein